MFGMGKRRIEELEGRLAQVERDRLVLEQELADARRQADGCRDELADFNQRAGRRQSFIDPFGHFCDSVEGIRGSFADLAHTLEGDFELAFQAGLTSRSGGLCML